MKYLYLASDVSVQPKILITDVLQASVNVMACAVFHQW